jgi:hypothetical protein
METRLYCRTYIVEATTSEHAEELAEKGETISESEGILKEVSEREILAPPTPIQ